MKWREIAVALIFYFCLTFILQRASGAYEVEFDGYTDEAAQVVTSLMVRDYVCKDFPHAPMAFAQNYYAHYPKVVFGMWPPLFHILLGIWTTVSSSREWVLLFQALAGASLATLTFVLVRGEFSFPLAFVGGLLLCVTRAAMISVRMVMPDALLGVLVCGALLAFARFVSSGSRRHALWFGILAGLALATKGNAISLALVPPAVILFLRRWDLIRNASLWLSAGVAGLIGLPWQILMARLQSGTIPYAQTTAAVFINNLYLYPQFCWSFAGPALTIAAGIGFVWAIVEASRGRATILTAVSLALTISFFVSHVIVTPFGPEARYFTQLLPPLIFLALGPAFVKLPRLASVTVGAVVLAVTALATLRPIQQKESYGMREAAAFLLSQKGVVGSATLVASDALGESTLVSEFALRDSNRPSYWVLRGNKSLASANWYGQDYHLLYPTTDALDEYLKSIPVRYLVLEDTAHPTAAKAPHQKMLEQIVKSHPEEWSLLEQFPQHQLTNVEATSIKIYRLIGMEGKRPSQISVSLGRTLGHSVTGK